jgi:hypothetical protein
MKKKKNGNKTLYAGIIIAVIAISCLSLYNTDVFNSRAEIQAEYSLTEPLPPAGSIVDQTTTAQQLYAIRSIFWHPNMYWQACAQAFVNDIPFITGFGGKFYLDTTTNPSEPLKIGLSDHIPAPSDILDESIYMAVAELPGLPETDVAYYVYAELPEPIALEKDREYYLVFFSEAFPSEAWFTGADDTLQYPYQGWYFRSDVEPPWNYYYNTDVSWNFFTWSSTGEPQISWLSLWWIGLIIIGAVGIAGYNYFRRK